MAKSYSIEVYNCTQLNVRKNSNSSSKDIGTVNKGYKGTATKVENNWYYVPAKGGWLSGKYLKVNGSTAKAPAKKKPLTKEQKAIVKVKEDYAKKIKDAKKKLNSARKLRDTIAKDYKKLTKNINDHTVEVLPKTYKLHVEDDREWMKAKYMKKRINPYSVKATGTSVTSDYSEVLRETTIDGLQVTVEGDVPMYTNKSDKYLEMNDGSTNEDFTSPTISEIEAEREDAEESVEEEQPRAGVRTMSVRTQTVTPAPTPYIIDDSVPLYDGKGVDFEGPGGSLTKTGFVDSERSFKGPSDTGTEDSMSADFELYTLLNNIDYLDANSYDRTFTEMNRFRLPFLGSTLSKAKAYVFFTRPTLHLFNSDGLRPQIADNSVLSHMYEQNPLILKSLTSKLSEHHGFNPFLSNAAQSMEIADEVMRTIEHGETYTGWKQIYARNTNESNTANQFSVQYTEDKDLNIYNMHKAWIEYMNLVMRGDITSTRYAIVNKVLDYACSVYYIMTGADGETILFWNKYIGVFPINTPASAFSWAADAPISNPKLTVNYMYSMREQMNVKALAEFNYLSHASSFGEFADIYNSDGYAMHNSTMVGMPFIMYEKNSNGGKDRFKLRFRPHAT